MKNINNLVGSKNIKTNIFRVQESNSIMCGYFCIGFIDFMLANKRLTGFYKFVFSLLFKKSDSIILRCFRNERNDYF